MNKFAKTLAGVVVIVFVFFASATAFATYIDFTDMVAGEDLWWDSEDGFGVLGSGHQNDETEQPELLCSEFDTPVYIESIHITDLFHGDDYFEIGWHDSEYNPESVWAVMELPISVWAGRELPKPAPTPEPATMLLFGSGLIGIAFLGRKKFFGK